MRIALNKVELFVDLERCDLGDPCSEDNTCRIHKIAWYLRITRQTDPKEEARRNWHVLVSAATAHSTKWKPPPQS